MPPCSDLTCALARPGQARLSTLQSYGFRPFETDEALTDAWQSPVQQPVVVGRRHSIEHRHQKCHGIIGTPREFPLQSCSVLTGLTAEQGQMAYSARFVGNTTVLSTRFAPTTSSVIQGLLYVPDLPYGDVCVLETSPYVPLSAVRQADLPPTNYHLIALAPWVNGRCSRAYLASARRSPVRAFLFYIPGNSSDSPPPADSPEWNIRGSNDWMARTGYPVYAVSGLVGEVMMQHLSLYSGDMNHVPFGQNISERFLSDPEDYLRIWTELSISTPSVPFGGWVYVLIIAGVLLIVVSTTSLLMHLVQALRRASLRRRVVAGEVNLEAMGIKRLTVPMEHIQKFPLFTYHYEPVVANPPLSPRSTSTARTRAFSMNNRPGSTAASRHSRSRTASEQGLVGPFSASTVATDYQPTCEICLEPYENRTTVIRELPCGHIFHPDCIDEFLNEVSSLCPICKASMLPEGYCPRVTNAMVRRERAIRRLRGRIEVQDTDEAAEPGRIQTWWATAKTSLFGGNKNPRPSTSTGHNNKTAQPRSATDHQHSIELQPRRSRQAQGADSRRAPRASARERMHELAGAEPDTEEGASTTRCTSAQEVLCRKNRS